ncbi:hypothetical protein GINT2_000444 [Glugoides intestinalis]
MAMHFETLKAVFESGDQLALYTELSNTLDNVVKMAEKCIYLPSKELIETAIHEFNEVERNTFILYSKINEISKEEAFNTISKLEAHTIKVEKLIVENRILNKEL